MSKLLGEWTPEDFGALEKGVLLADHRLIETGLFSDEGLARLIDDHPAECLHINTMGADSNRFEWREGDRNGVPGDVLLETVKKGRLWINVRNIMDHCPDIRAIVNEIYGSLQQNNREFQAHQRSANLLISSPNAMVHYHIDIPVNMLWHLRGNKRVWVYPHFDNRFVTQHVVEKVISGEFSEDVPYDPDFDKYALVYDVQPGKLLTWPQLTPHRVTNLDGLNVSLSTEHKNARAVRRINVNLANQFLRRTLGWPCRSASVDGPAAHMKQAIARAVRYYNKFTKKPKQHYTYPISFKVDPNEPFGFTDIDMSPDELIAPHERQAAESAS